MAWEKTHDSKFAQWHLNTIYNEVNNRNLIYSPGIDLIIAVDGFDPYTALEIAQILSSKITLFVGILKDRTAQIDNFNCLSYSLAAKNFRIGHSSILSWRQNPIIRLVDAIEKVELPAEYSSPERYEALLNLHEYAKFVIQCWHSIKLADSACNFLPMADYTNNFLPGVIPDNFNIPHNQEMLIEAQGIKGQIRKILYFSNSIDQALAEIETAWAAPKDMPFFRKAFYNLLEFPMPERFKNLTFSGNRSIFSA